MILATGSPDLVFFVLVALLVIAVPSLGIAGLVTKHTGPMRLITRLRERPACFERLPADVAAFQQAHGLALIDSLQYGNIPFAIYREPPGPPPDRCMVVMFAGNKYVSEFCTQFSENESLTTTRGTHAFVHPRPAGMHIQGFANLSLELLWARHLEAELFLLDVRRISVTRLSAESQDPVVLIERALRQQGEFLKTVPLYLLKAPYWFYVKRHRMVNKTLAQQFAKQGSSAA
jgi:hypothetical protein